MISGAIKAIPAREGKTKRVLSYISGCDIIISDSEVGIIGDFESVESLHTAILNLIKGTKHANAYRYIERMNTIRKNDFSDMEIKNPGQSKR